MYSLIISFIVYIISTFLLPKYFFKDIEQGMLKKLIIFIMASSISWGSAFLIDALFPSQALHIFNSSSLTSLDAQPNKIDLE